MQAVGRPVRYTALATASGFAVLLFMNIIPVKVFGGLVAFGTVVLRILSFSFIPAMFMFAKEEHLERASRGEKMGAGSSKLLSFLTGVGIQRTRVMIVTGLFLLIVSIIGISRIVVNNNMVEWFKKDSPIRVADREINRALGGTSLGYIVAISEEEDFIKNPETMRYIEGLQRHIERLPVVGKTFSVLDYLKRINLVLHDNDLEYNAVPDSKLEIGQYLFLFSFSARPSDLDNVVDPSFKKANIWV